MSFEQRSVRAPMPIAFNLRCDDDTGLPVRQLWADVGVLEDFPSMSRLGYPPHVTLVQSDAIKEATAIEALGTITLPESALDLTVLISDDAQP